MAHHPTDCKTNKVGQYKDVEEDEIKIAECGPVEAELRCGGGCEVYEEW